MLGRNNVNVTYSISFPQPLSELQVENPFGKPHCFYEDCLGWLCDSVEILRKWKCGISPIAGRLFLVTELSLPLQVWALQTTSPGV